MCGPVLGLLFGFAEDILSFFLTGGGGYPFFPGYTLTTMLGVLTYALFFYRAKVTISRVFLAKLLTNIQNVVLGALWMAILTGKAWYVTAFASALKNLIMLPVQTRGSSTGASPQKSAEIPKKPSRRGGFFLYGSCSKICPPLFTNCLSCSH